MMQPNCFIVIRKRLDEHNHSVIEFDIRMIGKPATRRLRIPADTFSNYSMIKLLASDIEGMTFAPNGELVDIKPIEGICPDCGNDCARDEVDNGVAMLYGPWGCPECGWSEFNEYNTKLNKGQDVDQFGGYTPQ